MSVIRTHNFTCEYVVDVLVPNSLSLLLAAADDVEKPYRLSANTAFVPEIVAL